MPNYTLVYFNFRGFGEYIRLLFKDNEIPYEEKRYTLEEWPQHKEKYPFHQLPIVYEDGKELCQAGAIMRHIARTHKHLKLYGTTEDEHVFVDTFFDGLRDLRYKYAHMIYNDYEHRDVYFNETLPNELKKIEKLFKTHKNGEAFILGDQISFADYMLFEDLDAYLRSEPACLDAFPSLKAFHLRFKERPLLKDYIASRKMNICGVARF